jgi:transcriptional regulator with XRE-family HTH domain
MEIRKAKRLSRQQLANLAGVNYLDVYRIETGFKKAVSADAAAVFAGALGVSVASLYRESRAAS